MHFKDSVMNRSPINQAPLVNIQLIDNQSDGITSSRVAALIRR
jgi:hypothetical protein